MIAHIRRRKRASYGATRYEPDKREESTGKRRTAMEWRAQMTWSTCLAPLIAEITPSTFSSTSAPVSFLLSRAAMAEQERFLAGIGLLAPFCFYSVCALYFYSPGQGRAAATFLENPQNDVVAKN